jgi:hypothetical protein
MWAARQSIWWVEGVYIALTHQQVVTRNLLRMGAPDSPVRQRCANGRLQWLVLTASHWADGTPDNEQSLSGAHRIVRCAVRCATKIQLANSALSGFCAGGKTFPGLGWPHWQRVHRIVRCPKARNPSFYFVLFFNSVFVLTREYVLE